MMKQRKTDIRKSVEFEVSRLDLKIENDLDFLIRQSNDYSHKKDFISLLNGKD
jgi:hypothetical protein